MHRPAEDLIEREDQLGTLGELLSAAVAGSGQTAVLSGASGNGKSVLLDRMRSLAGEVGTDVTTAIAACTEQSLPLGVIGQLAGAAGLLTSHAPEPAGAATSVAGLLDAAMSRDWDLAQDASFPPSSAKILHGLCMAFLRGIERRPMMLCIDDVHHADPFSMQFLSYLSRRVRATRLLMVLTDLPQLSPAHPAQYVELLHSSTPIVLTVPPLTRAGVADMVRRLPPPVDPGLAGHVHALTGGNPRLTAALVEDVLRRVEGPPAVGRPVAGEAFIEAVRTCLLRSQPHALPIARALAVTGGTAEVPVLAQLLSISEEMVDWGLLALHRVGLLPGHAFRDPRVQAAVLAGMPVRERAELHRRLAVLGPGGGEPADIVARHLVDAQDVEGAPGSRRPLGPPPARDQSMPG
ncbi:AAA family ATPase [Dactylosporangium cerinum]|uniref:AAA family ATPase n=1 Tax=Dactylosporangium cerinum TaxID=1434730 RepID=A0ABV9W0E2_9ACTN